MTAIEILDRFKELGVEVELIGDQVQVTPVAKIPDDLLAEAKNHKAEIVRELRPAYGDGQQPPLDRPPTTNQEIRRLYDYWRSEPGAFARWLRATLLPARPIQMLRTLASYK